MGIFDIYTISSYSSIHSDKHKVPVNELWTKYKCEINVVGPPAQTKICWVSDLVIKYYDLSLDEKSKSRRFHHFFPVQTIVIFLSSLISQQLVL